LIGIEAYDFRRGVVSLVMVYIGEKENSPIVPKRCNRTKKGLTTEVVSP